MDVASCMPMNSAPIVLDILGVQAQLSTCRSDDYMSAFGHQILHAIPSKTPLQLTGKTYVHPRLQYFVELLWHVTSLPHVA